MPAPVVRQSTAASANPAYADTLLASARPVQRTMVTRAPTASELDNMAGITLLKLNRLANSKIKPETLAGYASALEAQRKKGELNTPLRVAHFLSQLSHECMRFARMVEIFSYKPKNALATFPSTIKSEEQATKLLDEDTTGEAFANHVYATANGNKLAGDGYRFRGRGFIQLTGRGNYEKYSKLIAVKDVDLVLDPDRAAEADIAARIAVAFWTSNKINVIADRDDVSGVTRVINGKALKGLDDRRQLLGLAKNAFFTSP